jgi:hypothetical protein
MYKICETALKIPKDSEREDKRDHCLQIETATVNNCKHYLSLETRHQFTQVESCYYRAVYNAISTMQVYDISKSSISFSQKHLHAIMMVVRQD